MSRRICVPLLVTSFALAMPAATMAQSSSQAQYQGVAPETRSPVTGTAGGGPGGGGSAGGNVAGGGGAATGTGGSSGASNSSGASGNGGNTGTAAAPTGTQPGPAIAAPTASSDTAPFTGGDIVLIVVGIISLAAMGFALRRGTRAPAGA
jgi:hypothetical protein